MSHLTSIELFSGAGGLALGVSLAGFEHKLLLEYDHDACETLRANRRFFGRSCAIHEGDVHEFDFEPFKGIDLLAAGAPCQPFSIGGKHKADRDKRNLFPQVFRAIRETQPRAVIIENVKGLLRPSLRKFVEYVELQLANPTITPPDDADEHDWESHLPRLRHVPQQGDRGGLNYRVQRLLLNAADFGVPQKRERVFFVAIRGDVLSTWAAPVATHSQYTLRLEQEVSASYWRRHRLPAKKHVGHPKHGAWLREAGNRAAWQTVRDALKGLPRPRARQDYPGILNHVGQPGARSYPGHTGSELDAPAKTLKAGVHGVPGGENMLRKPDGTVRYFTVREAARLQTFDDNYEFLGAWGEALRQIGNAVPVALARSVAASLATCMNATSETDQLIRAQPSRFAQAALPGF